MRRRDFITLLGGAVAWPVAARAQQRPVPVIGVLYSGSPPRTDDQNWPAFRQGLNDTGFVEGQNVAIEFRFAADGAQAREFAGEFVRRRVAVIVAAPNGIATSAAKEATTTVPIVFVSSGDPVRIGLVANLNRPGGNLTGITQLNPDLTAKRIGLLHALVPQATLIAMLLNRPTSVGNPDFQLGAAEGAARGIGLRILGMYADDESDFNSAFASAVGAGAQALFVGSSIYFVDRRERLTALAARHKLPAMYQNLPFARAGGLMCYGADAVAHFRQAGVYTGRVLKGEKPADLPVLLPTKFDLVINLKTAAELRLTVPPSLLAIADEVIE